MFIDGSLATQARRFLHIDCQLFPDRTLGKLGQRLCNNSTRLRGYFQFAIHLGVAFRHETVTLVVEWSNSSS
jgi:hypothetical protein